VTHKKMMTNTATTTSATIKTAQLN